MDMVNFLFNNMFWPAILFNLFEHAKLRNHSTDFNEILWTFGWFQVELSFGTDCVTRSDGATDSLLVII